MIDEERVEMLSLEASLDLAKGLGLHERAAKLNIFRTLLHRPAVAKAISDLLLSLLLDSELSHRLRELVIMRIGWVTGCDYEWTQHWPPAQVMGDCTPEELHAKANELRGEAFNVKIKRSTGQLENTAKLGQLRRDIARVETVLREKREATK